MMLRLTTEDSIVLENKVKLRLKFRDVLFDEWPAFLEQPIKYLRYDLHEELPDFDSVRDGNTHSIVLKNEETGKLEKIEYYITPYNDEVSGGVRYSNLKLGYSGYEWIYAHVRTDDHLATINFNFDCDGNCRSISILVRKTWFPERE